MSLFRYRAHGLGIHSAVELDLEQDDDAAADLTISLSSGAPPAAGPGIEVVRYDHGTTFSIAHGAVVTAYTTAPIDDITAEFLTGPAVAIALFQRGHAVLHASCVLTNGRATAFIGESRAGKSTIAGALVRNGHELFADDFIAFDGSDIIHRGAPRLRLWHDSAHATGFAPPHTSEKLTLRVRGATAATTNPLLFLLADATGGGPDCVTPLAPADVLYQLLGHSYCVSLFGMQDLKQQFERWSRLSTTLQCFRLTRARELQRLDETVRLIEQLASHA